MPNTAFTMSFARFSRWALVLPLLACLAPQAQAVTFVDSLPPEARENVLWSADHEDNNLAEWEDAGTGDYYSGGGVFLTDEANVTARTTDAMAHTGDYSAEAAIRNAYRAQNGNKAVRYMRWTDKPWNQGGDYFPRTAFYSVWMYFPCNYNPNKYEPWDPGDGGWWNVFQFKSDNNAGSQPVAELDIYRDEDAGRAVFGLSLKHYPDPDSSDHVQTYVEQNNPIPIPVGRWFHVEALYVKDLQGQGEIRVWQDGRLIFSRQGLVTALSEQCTWGIGNYTDHIACGQEEGSATLYFDDAVVATTRIGAFVDFSTAPSLAPIVTPLLLKP